MLFLCEIQFGFEFSQFLNTNLRDRDKGLHNKIQVTGAIFGLCYASTPLSPKFLYDGIFPNSLFPLKLK